MYELARITGYKLAPEGTYIIALVKNKDLTESIIEKNMHDCTIWIDDGRHMSAAQNKKAHATIGDIASFTGEVPEVMKAHLKNLYVSRTGAPLFSFKDCSMETAREFINVILDYALEMGNNRRTLDDSEHRKICLCRIHHTEAHATGFDSFSNKYKVYGIKFVE